MVGEPTHTQSMRLMRPSARAAIAIAVVCMVQPDGVAMALGTEEPDAGSSGQPDAEASTSPEPGASTRGDTPAGPLHTADMVCLSRYVKMRSSFLVYDDLGLAKWRWAHCQKCPDAWSKCEPCSDEQVLRVALEIAGYLVFAGDKKRTQAAVVEQQIASAVHDRHPDVADQLRRKKQDGLAQAQSQYQEALDYYVTALRVSSHPELRVPGHPLRDEVLVGLADLYYFNLDRPDLGAEHYQKLIGTKVDAEIVTHARLMLGEILFSKGDWRGAERELRKASKLGVLAVSELPGRGAEREPRKLSKLVTGIKALCATYKRAWVLVRMGRTTLARKVFRDCAGAKRQEDIVESAAASVRRVCAADERQLYP
jgi:hypothetical protein